MTMDCILSFFMAKARDMALRKRFGTLNTKKNMHLKESWRLKAQMEVMGTMKETLELVEEH